MPKKRKSASKSSPPLRVQGSRNGLTHALEPVATVLAEELAALLAAVLDGRKKRTLDRLLPPRAPKTKSADAVQQSLLD